MWHGLGQRRRAGDDTLPYPNANLRGGPTWRAALSKDVFPTANTATPETLRERRLVPGSGHVFQAASRVGIGSIRRTHERQATRARRCIPHTSSRLSARRWRECLRQGSCGARSTMQRSVRLLPLTTSASHIRALTHAEASHSTRRKSTEKLGTGAFSRVLGSCAETGTRPEGVDRTRQKRRRSTRRTVALSETSETGRTQAQRA